MLLDRLEAAGAVPVIPSHGRRNHALYYDRQLYRQRRLAACLISRLEHYRRLFSRFEKLASRYLGFLHVAAALIWLR